MCAKLRVSSCSEKGSERDEKCRCFAETMVRPPGFEPGSPAREAEVLPG